MNGRKRLLSLNLTPLTIEDGVFEEADAILGGKRPDAALPARPPMAGNGLGRRLRPFAV